MTVVYFNRYEKIDHEITYSKSYSRPSKSLIDPELYNNFKTIKVDPFEKIKEYTLRECIGYYSNNYTTNGEYINIDNIDYKYICGKKINEIYNKIKTCNNFIIEIKDIYMYPKIQFIYLLSGIFKNVLLILSQYTNVVYVICENKLRNLENSEDKNIKDFNIKVDTDLINEIYIYNNSFFEKIIKLNDIISTKYQNTEDIYNDIKIINEYHINYINKKCIDDCYCNNLIYSELLECYICKNCFSLHKIDHFLFLRACQDSATHLKASL
jgi:hypothetical protein